MGAKPIITGINNDLNMPVEDLSKLITKKTKAIILVHMLGYSAEMIRYKNFVNKKKFLLLKIIVKQLVQL